MWLNLARKGRLGQKIWKRGDVTGMSTTTVFYCGKMTPVVRRARVPLNREIRYSGLGPCHHGLGPGEVSSGMLPTTNARPCLFGSACGRMFIDFVHQSDKEIIDVFMKPCQDYHFPWTRLFACPMSPPPLPSCILIGTVVP